MSIKWSNINKLSTKEDSLFIHKILGTFVIIHCFYRFYLLLIYNLMLYSIKLLFEWLFDLIYRLNIALFFYHQVLLLYDTIFQKLIKLLMISALKLMKKQLVLNLRSGFRFRFFLAACLMLALSLTRWQKIIVFAAIGCRIEALHSVLHLLLIWCLKTTFWLSRLLDGRCYSSSARAAC